MYNMEHKRVKIMQLSRMMLELELNQSNSESRLVINLKLCFS